MSNTESHPRRWETFKELTDRYGEPLYKIDFNLSRYKVRERDDYEIPYSVAVFSMKNTSPHRPDVIIFASYSQCHDEWHANKGERYLVKALLEKI